MEAAKPVVVVVLVVMLVAAFVPPSSGSLSTAPAFLWSKQFHENSEDVIKESVNYQTISPRDLAKSVLSDGGWSGLLCSEKKLKQPVDLAMVFVGRELLSSDISCGKRADPNLLDLLKVSFTRSNFSMAFPYVAASEEEAVETSLFSGFTESCGLNSNKVAFLGSCSVKGGSFHKLADMQSLHKFLDYRKEKGSNGQVDLIMICHESDSSDVSRSEREILFELLSSVEQSGESYAVLYLSDPMRSIAYPSSHLLKRFLAEQSDISTNSTCDGVCQIKSSLLEGVLVGIVLLIILISGLCCMMGIQTPTRFETPQES